MHGLCGYYAAQAALKYGVPVFVFLKQIEIESAWNERAYNTQSHATGIGQWLPPDAKQPGFGVKPFDPTNPVQSLFSSAQYVAAMFKKFGAWDKALWAYNAGVGNIERGDLRLVSRDYMLLGHFAASIGNLTLPTPTVEPAAAEPVT